MSSTPLPSTKAQPADQRARKFVWPLSLSAWNAVDDSWAPPSQQPKEYKRENRKKAEQPRRKFVWPLSMRVWNAVDDCWAVQETPSESISDLGPAPRGLYRDSIIIINNPVRVCVGYVLRITWFVLAWANETRKAIARRVFGLNPESVEETNTTNVEFSKVKKAYQGTLIKGFFFNNPKFFEELVGKAVALADDPSTPIYGEKLLSKTIQVTMHQQVLYCDDSSSMRRENRWDSQNELIKTIARVTTRILPEGEGVYMRYINQEIPSSHSLRFEKLVGMIMPPTLGGNTPLGTILRSKVLKPLVYSKLPSNLNRPLLISIITAGCPDAEPESELVKVIVECGDRLEGAGLPRECVKFMVGQVGSDPAATTFLQSIDRELRIKNVVFVASKPLDVAYSKLKSDWERDAWVINTLYEPIMKSESKKDR